MQPDRIPPETTFWQAALNGYACKAFAWIQTTSLDVLDGQGGRRTVEGIRRWRGRAIIDREALPGALASEAPLRYTGKVRDGDEERDINAEVFVCFARTYGGPETPPDLAAGRAYVEFIGAATPFR